MAVEDSVAQDQIRAFVERIERMEEEKKAIGEDIKSIYAEAKGNGFDVKILRRVVGIRKQDANERLEQEAILELYMSALGMVAAPPEYSDERERLNSMASRVNSALSKPTTITPPQPTKAAGSDLAIHPALNGQVADIQPETAAEAGDELVGIGDIGRDHPRYRCLGVRVNEQPHQG